MSKYSILILFLFSFSILDAQVKSFELGNPDAILLDEEKIELLKSKLWRGNRIDLENRGTVTESRVFASIHYFSDGRFTYNRVGEGRWELIDKKYIKHELNNKEDENRFNFGGIYSATTLTDSTLTLTKLLTSSNDMKRTIYLISPELSLKRCLATPIGAFMYGQPYVHHGRINDETLDSISTFRPEQLFIAGYNFQNDTMQIQTEDSLYRIKIKIRSKSK